MKEKKESDTIDFKGIQISFFEGGISNVTDSETITLEEAIYKIETGVYDEKVDFLRTLDEKGYKKRKKELPYFVFGCTCTRRDSKHVDKISGLIIIDVDKLQSLEHAESIKDDLRSDKYTIAVWVSPSGKGLKILFKYDYSQFKIIEAFEFLREYLMNEYTIEIDDNGKDITRACFVSSDNEIWINENATNIPITMLDFEKDNKSKIQLSPLVCMEEYNQFINFIEESNINITETYNDWVLIGFIIVSSLGEFGRPSFHLLSSMSAKYDADLCDLKYSNLLRTNNKYIPIDYLYHRSGYKQYNGKKKTILGIVDFILSKGLRLNLVTRYLELPDGRRIEERDINTLVLELISQLDSVTDKLFIQIINSHYIPAFNPLKDAYFKYLLIKSDNEIDRLFQSLEYEQKGTLLDSLILKYLLQIPAAINGHVSELLMVLIGPQGNGKTEFFRRIFPSELLDYFAIDKLDKGKDSDILMTLKAFILDDEFAGKSKKDSSHLKGLLSKDMFSLRRPYGRVTEDIPRLAVLGGTSNVPEIIYDSTGNRRIIPVELISRDFDVFDIIDKRKLWAEIFQIWEKDNDAHKISTHESIYLQEYSKNYMVVNYEREMLESFITECKPKQPGGHFMSASEIANYIHRCSRRTINPIRIGQELSQKKFRKYKSNGKRGYWVKLDKDLKSYEYPLMTNVAN